MMSDEEIEGVPRWMYVAAFRYYLGRRTAARGYMTDWLREHAGEVPKWLREQMVKEIEEADDLGMECDAVAWMNVLQAFIEVDA
jgi:hypothetical protein